MADVGLASSEMQRIERRIRDDYKRLDKKKRK